MDFISGVLEIVFGELVGVDESAVTAFFQVRQG